MRSSVAQPGQVAGQADGATLGRARTPSVPEGLEPGALLLGKYRVDRILGRGGMGCVAAVRNEDLGELFAMKLLLPEIAGRPGAVERFVHEARAAARLRTPHVVRVYDVGRLDDGAPYMLMEYLEGKDLGALLEDRGVLTPCEVVDYMLEALDAMCEAHALGIIHRDLKPANLFITPGRERSLLKVLDFGISKDLDSRAQSMTQSGGLMGSPYYMSPEHMRSAKRVDARTDLWSLGVIMFELLSGKLPFDGDTTTEVCSAVLEAPLPSLAALAPTTPAALVEVVERCLRRSADERYANGHELASALRRVRDDLGDAPRSRLASTRAFDGPRVWAADLPTLMPRGDADAQLADYAPAALRAPSLEPWHASVSPAPRRSRCGPSGSPCWRSAGA